MFKVGKTILCFFCLTNTLIAQPKLSLDDYG